MGEFSRQIAERFSARLTPLRQRWLALNETHLPWVILIVLALHILRNPTAFFNPQFYAEDATIFFVQDYSSGLNAFFQTYAGYLHAWPRLWTFLIGFFPLFYVPLLTKIGALIHHFVVLLLIKNSRLKISTQNKALMMMSTVLVVSGGEVFGNLTNGISFAAIVLVLLFSLDRAESKTANIIDFLMVLIAGLSGPYVLFVTPILGFLFLVRKVNLRDYLVRLVAVLIAFFTQLYFLDLSNRTPKATNYNLDDWSRSLEHFFRPLFFGELPLNRGFSQIATLLIIWFLYRYFTKESHIKEIIRAKPLALFFISAVIIHSAALFIKRDMPGEPHPYGSLNRYFYVPYVLFYWAIINKGFLSQEWVYYKRILLIVLSLAALHKFRGPDQAEYYWANQVKKFEASQEGWQVFSILPTSEWKFTLIKDQCWRCK